MRTLNSFFGFTFATLLATAVHAEDSTPAKTSPFFTGADLSYVNEMEDCGGKFRDRGKEKDPFAIFASYGADIVRVRIWHNATWTKYSNFDDVAKTIRRAKENHMRVLLDFHYSDTWTDPEKQGIPSAWKDISDTHQLAKALYDYTADTLKKLNDMGLAPNMVQVGNETNAEILQDQSKFEKEKINWARNAELFNSGIKAVRDFSAASNKKVAIVLHIAQPENGLAWFPKALENGITDFDVIGLSYYPQWSTYKLDTLGNAISELTVKIKKPVMIVETGYPWTFENFDKADNVLWKSAVLPEYPPTPNGQLDYLLALSKAVKTAGGLGIIYWEPAWISTSCKTLWGTGSHWENAAFFDASRKNTTLPAFNFFREAKK
jgi:arabinogalactan endo-1,4-beta-galactosidase